MKAYVIKNIDATLRYHDLPGSGTPIVFIHGLGCAGSFDYPQVASMSRLVEHRRILVDLLGSGFSDKPDSFGYGIDDHAAVLEDFVRSAGIAKFAVYGHSMGGSIALSLAHRCPDRIEAIILSEANLDAGGGFFSQKIASYGERHYIAIGHAETIRSELEESNENSWAASLSTSLPKAIFREAVSLIEGQSPGWREIFYALDVPKTYIFGELSLPDPDLETLAGRGIHVEIVNNAGHSMPWENPEGLAQAIVNGLNPSRQDWR